MSEAMEREPVMSDKAPSDALPAAAGAAAGPISGGQKALLTKTAKATGWVMIWRLFTRTIGLISTLILVRLLVPADFGLVALGTSFAQAIDALSVLGVDDVLIREKSPTPALYNTAFTLNALRNCLTALLILLTAIPVASFFGEPRLAHILFALALGTVAEAFENVGIIDFRRDMTFEKEFQLRLIPRLAGTIATITLAFLWRNYWALVVGILLTRFLRVAMSYTMHPYRARFSLSAWRHIIGFSLWTWVISLVVLMRDRTASFVIGRLLGPAQVGIFSIAGEIASLPTTELIQPICRACFSAFAAARPAGENLAETYLRVIGSTSLLTMPACVGIALVAEPLVQLALGPRWMSAVPLLQIMALGGVFTVFGAISGTLLSSHGVLAPMFRIITFSYVIGATLFIMLTLKLGLIGGVIGGTLGSFLETSLFTHALFRRYGVTLGGLFGHIWRPFLATAAMAGLLLGSGLTHVAANADAAMLTRTLLILIPLGVVAYTLALLIVWTVAGRPQGPETDLLTLVQPVLRRLSTLFRGRRARAG
uniref:Lipopolysaccharide biosynthesis protein n=1 Tax=Acidicaldus sp. TaxID=1872105 RepID=A0A8J4HDC7_9PROT